MKKNRIWVAAGALLQLLYIAAACWHCWNGRLWEAVGMIAFRLDRMHDLHAGVHEGCNT